MKRKTQAGWFLLETMIALVIGFVVLSASTQFFFASYAELNKLVDTWARIAVFERWRINWEDLLNEKLAETRCGASSRVSLLLANKTDFKLHACRRVDQQWQWIDTQYYVKSKRGVHYVYEKIGAKLAVAWIPRIKQLKVYPIKSASIKKGMHVFAVDLIEEAVSDEGAINPHLVLEWQDGEK